LYKPEFSAAGTAPNVETKSLADDLTQEKPLIIIFKKVAWQRLEDELSKKYSTHRGRPSLPIRLLIGLLILKYLLNLSDERVVEEWQENVYFQAFTGGGQYIDKRPCHPSMLTVFRNRIGIDGCELILQESVRVNCPKALEKKCAADTTVQEKNITFPTDSKLIFAAISLILRVAKFLGIKFPKLFAKERKELKSKINFGKDKITSETKSGCVERLREIGNTLLITLTGKLPKHCWTEAPPKGWRNFCLKIRYV
jgi:IS5 family transposase